MRTESMKRELNRYSRESREITTSSDLYSHNSTKNYNGTVRDESHKAAGLVSRLKDPTFEYEAVSPLGSPACSFAILAFVNSRDTRASGSPLHILSAMGIAEIQWFVMFQWLLLGHRAWGALMNTPTVGMRSLFHKAWHHQCQ